MTVKNVRDLGDIIKTDEYAEIKNEVEKFLIKLIRKSFGEIDTIVKVNRKGNTILLDFFENHPEFEKFIIKSNEDIESKEIRGLKVLVFDDSARTGTKIRQEIGKIQKFGPKEIKVAVLLINKKALKNIRSFFPKIEISSFKKFNTYDDQQQYFMSKLLTYIEGIKGNVNTDFPRWEITLDRKIDIDSLYKILKGLQWLKKFNSETYYVQDYVERENIKRCTTEINDYSIPRLFKPFNSYVKKIEICKIRYYISNLGDNTKLTIVPIIIPIFDYSLCTIKSILPQACFLPKRKKECNIDERDVSKYCKNCGPFFLSLIFLEDIRKEIRNTLREKGIQINKESLISMKLK